MCILEKVDCLLLHVHEVPKRNILRRLSPLLNPKES